MRALLTGASSFSGYWFARALVEKGFEVVATLRGAAESYSGVRQRRVRALAEVAEIAPGVAFGSEEFFNLLEHSHCDVLCHHAARVTDYRNADFDVSLALTENTREFRVLSERLVAKSTSAVVVTGSVFEPGEGAGTAPLRAFSPYGLSKAMTWETIQYWCDVADLPLGKFVIANPFGPLEEPRFCAYLVKTWAADQTAQVRTPLYVRDNIHIRLLALAYAEFVIKIVTEKRSMRLAPTFYVESQGSFAERFAREMRKRVSAPCRLELGTQTEFSEPMVRINTDPIDLTRLDWSEAASWDEIAHFYAPQLPLR